MNAAENKRLLALDILRGITIAGMILVNNPGSWSAIYAPLEHASWNGLTPTDLVFPFFMFIMGASTYLSLKKFDFRCSRATVRKILRRVLVIFLIGVGIGWFSRFCGTFNALSDEGVPFWERIGRSCWTFDRMRILGVMQRLALSYGAAALIAVTGSPPGASRGSPRDCSPVISRSCYRDTDSKFPNKTSSASSTEQYSARRTCTVRAISPSTRKDC